MNNTKRWTINGVILGAIISLISFPILAINYSKPNFLKIITPVIQMKPFIFTILIPLFIWGMIGFIIGKIKQRYN